MPVVAISAYLEPGTVVSDEYRNTSLIRTLRERWPLGGPLTARDAAAADIAPLLTRATPRRQEDWPDVVARPVPAMSGPIVPLDEPLDPEARGILEAALAHAKKTTGRAPTVDLDTVTGKEAVAILDEFAAGIFPGLAGKRGG